MTVDEAHTFFAEGLLTYNCADALQYLCLGTISHNDWRPENEREDEDDAMPVRRVARTASYSGY